MELFKLLGIVAIENDTANKAIDETVSVADSAQGKLETAFEKIGSFAVKAGQVIATGLAAGSAAVGALTKQSVDYYAEYEQLSGGAAKIFDEMSQTDIVYDAASAYETLGMTANEYLSVINDVGASFAATMGDAAGYETAKTGLTAISDYASGTGKSVDELSSKFTLITKSTSSYQSIADQFSGILPATSDGFLEQAQAAGLLNDSYEKLTDVPVAEYQAAVSEMLAKGVDDLGLTGNTAMEAATTISGSLTTTKKSWQNLVGALSNGGADLGYFIDSFCESALNAIHNLVPRIGQALSGITEVIAQLMPVIAAELPGLMEELLPGVISGATALITGLITALPGILQILLEQVPFIISQLGSALITAFPLLLETVKNLFGQIWDYFAVELLGTETDFETMLTNVQNFFQDAWTVLQSIWDSIGQPVFDIIQNVVETVRGVFAEKMPEIVEFVSNCFTDIQDFWNNNLLPCFEAIGDFIENVLAPAFDVAFNSYIKEYVDICFEAIKNLWENTLKPIFTGITDFLTGVFSGNWSQAFTGIKNIVSGAWNGIKTITNTLSSQMKNIVSSALTGVKTLFGNSWNNIKSTVSNAWSNIKSTVSNSVSNVKIKVSSAFSDVKSTISTAMTNALSTVTSKLTSIKNKFSSILESAKTVVSNAIEKIKGFFNFSWSLPHIALPHFSISGSFSLNPPSIPTFGVSWYKKAYENAMILNDPTIFGFSPKSGNLLGGGEGNGGEVISGADTLMGMISNAVAEQNSGLAEVLVKILNAIISMDGNMEDSFKNALDGTPFKINNREFGRLVKAVNTYA